MTYPTAYKRAFGYQQFQDVQPDAPPPGNALDTEFDDIVSSIGGIVSFLRKAFRSDGKLANASVGLDQLSAAAVIAVSGGTVIAAETGLSGGAPYDVDHDCTLTDSGSVIAFNTQGVSNGLVCTVSRALGVPLVLFVADVLRDIEDATSNPITVVDEDGMLVGQILEPVAAGTVPGMRVYADGRRVWCRRL
jgi:hypothetical protein